jgi:toxin ParE1/3/4
MNRCVMTLKASQDLDEISEYFVSHNIESGERLLQLFTEKCTKLMQFPSMGKLCLYSIVAAGSTFAELHNFL